MDSIPIAELVFTLTLICTFVAAALGRRHSGLAESEALSEQKLNKWLVGLSAGAAANSGFVVTGAVGLGYAYGAQWLFLPIAWLLGDIVFWLIFPHRINRVGRKYGISTMSELITFGMSDRLSRVTAILTTLVVVACLGGYISAQWLAGQKFLAGAFGLSSLAALTAFSILIVAYTSVGGFRGSVYADSFQAIVRLVGTVVALGAVMWFVHSDPAQFHRNIASAGAGFLNMIPTNVVGFTLGFACAALGFGLGQPQVVSRYLAGSSPEETRSAWWIYIGFVQFTWIAMTLFGVLLRGVMPGIPDPETALSVFFAKDLGGVFTGIIVADIFATIAATTNSLLVSTAQAVTCDLLPSSLSKNARGIATIVAVLCAGVITMAASIFLAGQQSVFQVALSSISLMGAGLAAPVMIKVMEWRHSSGSILASVLLSLAAAICWKFAGMDASLNEAAIGLVTGLITNFIVAFFVREQARRQLGAEI